MDSKITTRFYEVLPLNKDQASFEACLKQLAKLTDEKLVCDVGDTAVQGSSFSEIGTRFSGDLVRLQSDNFPTFIDKPGAKPKKLSLTPGGYLGHHSCFLFDSTLQVLAYQYARNSVSLSRFNLYVAGLCKADFGFLPIMQPASLKQLNQMTPRTLLIKVADPADLKAIENDQLKLKESLVNLRDLASGMYVKLQIGLGHNKGQLHRGRIGQLVNWLLDERANDSGGVTSIKVIGKDIDDEDVPLDFIKAQLGESEVLSLGLEGPDENYNKRAAFLEKSFEKNLATLKGLMKK